jgi:hypothetical protein
MTDACCKYCTWLGHAEPKTLTTSWEPLRWVCDQRETVREGFHHCAKFQREVGSDDDLGSDDFGEGYGDAI